jgi:hypothetical protein
LAITKFETGFALNRIILDARRRRGFEPDISLPGSLARARRRLPDEDNRGAGPAIALVSLDDPGTERNLAMAWRPGVYLSPGAGAWLGLMREAHSGPEMQASE